jgi:hypothetical protein
MTKYLYLIALLGIITTSIVSIVTMYKITVFHMHANVRALAGKEIISERNDVIRELVKEL